MVSILTFKQVKRQRDKKPDEPSRIFQKFELQMNWNKSSLSAWRQRQSLWASDLYLKITQNSRALELNLLGNLYVTIQAWRIAAMDEMLYIFIVILIRFQHTEVPFGYLK